MWQSGTKSRFAGIAALLLALPYAVVAQTREVPTVPPPAQTSAARLDPAAAPASSTRLPEAYLPMSEMPLFNSNEPAFISDDQDLSRLKVQAPQWVRQFISFPSVNELTRHVGAPTADTRKRAVEAVEQVVNPLLLPESFESRLIPLSAWGVLYDDWRAHGGVDVFLTKFRTRRHTVLICEAPNHIILLARDMEGVPERDFAKIKERAAQFTDQLLNEHMKPVNAAALETFRTSLSPTYVYGYYIPKVEQLAGTASIAELVTTGGLPNESSSSEKSTAVRYFCTGDFIALMILKPAFGTALKNPFEQRFDPLWVSQSEETPFWDREGAGAAVQPDLKRRQVEEFLGRHFYDHQGRRISVSVGYDELEKIFMDLSPEQKLALVEERMSDEYYLAGLRAFNGRDFASALDYWTRLLDLDNDDARAAVLLNAAMARRSENDLDNDPQKVKTDRYIGRALDALARQQMVLTMQRDRKQQDAVRERAIADYRTQALNLLSEGNYEDSLREWKKLLSIDPGNPTGLLYEDILERRIKGAVRRK